MVRLPMAVFYFPQSSSLDGELNVLPLEQLSTYFGPVCAHVAANAWRTFNLGSYGRMLSRAEL